MTTADESAVESQTKTVIVFAGPNGSGKSTINARVLSDPDLGFDGVYINADDIAKNLEGDFASPRERNIAAAVQAEELRLKCLETGQSFAFETVMSTPEKVALMSQARAQGYDVHFVFVTTDNPEINVQRVANRVASGGHDVPADAIRSRYESAMQLLPVAIEQATSVLVFDNSVAGRDVVLVAQKMRGSELEIFSGADIPVWAEERLQKDFSARIESMSALGRALLADGYDREKQSLIMAEAKHGAAYSGRVVAVTALHLLQSESKDKYLVHARALAQERSYRVGSTALVTYAYDKGKLMKLSQEKER
jgi:predicted ABC-type ATPase